MSLVVLAALIAAAVARPATAQSVTFDTPIPAGVSVSYITNTFAPLASLPSLVATPLTLSDSAVPGGGSALLLNNASVGFGDYGALFTFANALSSFSVVGADFGGDPVLDNERVFLTAFDSAGQVIATSTTHDAYAQPNLQFASIAGTDIKSVAFTFDTDIGYYALDNAVGVAAVTSVPEPETYALMSGGLIALLGVVRRRRKVD